jgi:hypothetical protein
MSFLYQFYENKSHCVRDGWGQARKYACRNQVAMRSQNQPIVPYQIRKVIHAVTENYHKETK